MVNQQSCAPFDLDRFVQAQSTTYATALDEIRRGHKHSHWMWFIFPQITGLGSSPMAQRYAIATRAEAQAYLAHDVLGPRYRVCVEALQALPHRDAQVVFGGVDAMKLRSSLTLFADTSGEAPIANALQEWFGAPDMQTLRRMRDPE
jgi:uncharacterized protein (DUF1810 family)